jgi:hypothetical protein
VAATLSNMMSLGISFALKELSLRNARLATAYHDWARNMPPGPATRLAESMSEQRRELGKALGELAADPSISGVEVEFESAPASAAGSDASEAPLTDPKVLLKRMAEAEDADHEYLVAIAGAVLPASTQAAERFAAEAAAARKRSTWAQDQLELLSML